MLVAFATDVSRCSVVVLVVEEVLVGRDRLGGNIHMDLGKGRRRVVVVDAYIVEWQQPRVAFAVQALGMEAVARYRLVALLRRMAGKHRQ
jgi:hypothetical protein